MPVQEIVDCAVERCVPDRLLVGRLEIMDVLHLAGGRRPRKASQQGVFLSQGHVLVLASTIRLGLKRLDATCQGTKSLRSSPLRGRKSRDTGS